MKGLEIMLMGIYATIQNGTNYNDGRPAEINGELDTSKIHISLAEENLKNRNDTVPPEIKVTSWQNMPYSGLMKNENGTWMGKGYAFEIFNLIQKKLNFTYTIIPPNDWLLGDEVSGMMGLLYNKKVDMAVAFIPTLVDLNRMCTFSTVMDDAEISFMMKRPIESATGQGILAPFSDDVWFCILVSWIVFGPIMYILILIRSRISSNNQREKYSLPTCMWFTYGALLKQGTTSEPITNSTRLLFATWWIFITILTSFYTANLTAFLTLSEFTLPYNHAKDIVDKHQKWVALKNNTLDDALSKGHSDILDELKKSVQRNEGFFIEDDYGIILNAVDMGKIFLGDRYLITRIIANDYEQKTIGGVEETNRCTYVMQPENIFVMRRAFAFQKDSSLKEQMNRRIMHLVETGIIKHLRLEDLPSVNVCPLNLKSKERRLRNTDLTMTYKAMAVGFILSAILFLVEITYRYICREKCFKCCSNGDSRTKTITPILPIHSINYKSGPPIINKQSTKKSLNTFEKLYRQNRVEKDVINGREYWVITGNDGDRRLVPIRTPSALLFQCMPE